MSVNIPSLKAVSKSMLYKVNKPTIKDNDKIKIINVKKYLFISLTSILAFENKTLFRITCLGLACDKSSLKENFVKRYIFKNLIPELVETREPPIITKIK